MWSIINAQQSSVPVTVAILYCYPKQIWKEQIKSSWKKSDWNVTEVQDFEVYCSTNSFLDLKDIFLSQYCLERWITIWDLDKFVWITYFCFGLPLHLHMSPWFQLCTETQIDKKKLLLAVCESLRLDLSEHGWRNIAIFLSQCGACSVGSKERSNFNSRDPLQQIL